MIISREFVDVLRKLGANIQLADTSHMDGAPIGPVDDIPECNLPPTSAPPDGSGE